MFIIALKLASFLFGSNSSFVLCIVFFSDVIVFAVEMKQIKKLWYPQFDLSHETWNLSGP